MMTSDAEQPMAANDPAKQMIVEPEPLEIAQSLSSPDDLQRVSAHQSATKCVMCMFVVALVIACGALGLAWFGTIGDTSLGDRLIAGVLENEQVPLTMTDAESSGWTKIDQECGDFGFRFQKGERIAPVPMYDNKGSIIGVQVSAYEENFPQYPATNLQEGKGRMNTGSGMHGLVYWFRDPEIVKVCDAEEAQERTDLGDGLWLQVGEEDYLEFPLTEDIDELEEMNLDKGGCTDGMGQHYWKNLTGPEGPRLPAEELSCFFLLYGDGTLVGWGTALASGNGRTPSMETPGNLWEEPKQPLSPYFFQYSTMPIVLDHLNEDDDSVTVATMHMWVSDPTKITCS